MNPEFFIVPILAGSIAYKIIAYIYYLRLRNRLNGGNIICFQEVLGNKFRYRPVHSGVVRYKWKKALIVVKADFDNLGNLRHTGKVPFRIFKLRSEMLFT